VTDKPRIASVKNLEKNGFVDEDEKRCFGSCRGRPNRAKQTICALGPSRVGGENWKKK